MSTIYRGLKHSVSGENRYSEKPSTCFFSSTKGY